MIKVNNKQDQILQVSKFVTVNNVWRFHIIKSEAKIRAHKVTEILKHYGSEIGTEHLKVSIV